MSAKNGIGRHRASSPPVSEKIRQGFKLRHAETAGHAGVEGTAHGAEVIAHATHHAGAELAGQALPLVARGLAVVAAGRHLKKSVSAFQDASGNRKEAAKTVGEHVGWATAHLAAAAAPVPGSTLVVAVADHGHEAIRESRARPAPQHRAPKKP